MNVNRREMILSTMASPIAGAAKQESMPQTEISGQFTLMRAGRRL